VLMPSYLGRGNEDAQAKAAYEAGIAGVTVVPINADDSITAGGSIHCVTQTIAVLPPSVEDTAFTPVPEFGVVSMTLEPGDYAALPTAALSALDQLKAAASGK